MKSFWAFIGRFSYFTLGRIALPLVLRGTERSRVALIDKKTQRILLCKNWISAQDWQLVGGGAKQDEDFVVAAVREVFEETGHTLSTSELDYLGDLDIHELNTNYKARIFLVYVDEFEPIKARFELLDLAWHKLDKLPKNSHMKTINFIKNKLK